MILTAAVIAQAAPERTLVYAFSVGVTNDTSDSSLGNGQNSYTGGSTDLGSITVAVVGLEPDGGLVVKVSESGRNNRTVAPAMCVVYANTNVVCDQSSVQVTPEEFVVLRPLNPKFLNPTALDAKSHWQVAPPGSGVSIDYTLEKPDASGAFPINGTRDEKTPQSLTHTEITYAYDPAKVVAKSIKEYQRIHQQGGNATGTTTVDVTANLTSDSLSN
jgi:hypothetical protein